MMMARHIVPAHCWGVIIDVQDFFLSQTDKRLRSKMKTNIKNFARLLGYFRIPIVATLERPVDQKGSLPKEINKHLSDLAETFEKDFFDLTREKTIRDYGAPEEEAGYRGRLRNRCLCPSVLPRSSQSWLRGLRGGLSLFSSSRNVDSAIARMKAEGAIFLTYKSLYYELIEGVKGGRHTEEMRRDIRTFPR